MEHAEDPLPLEAILRKLPPRNQGRFSRPGDPLNLVFVGPEASLIQTLESAGWTRIPISIAASTLGGIGELLTGRPLARFPPMNDYLLLGRVQDFNWAIPTRAIYSRHHFRLWRTPYVDLKGRQVWWGTGNYDMDVRWWDLSHIPDPSMDLEREYIASTLKDRARLSRIPLPQIPRSGVNDRGYPFTSDGRALLVELTV